MANQVRIKASVDDNASTPLDRIRDKFDYVRKQGAKPVIAGVAAAGALKAFDLVGSAIDRVTNVLGEAVEAALAEEESIAKLDAALRANVSGYDGNRKAIEDVLQARMRLGFSDDEQRASLARLVASTKDSAKALDLQRQAMDLARFRGIDLATASDIIAKVYGGNTSILARYGIQLAKGTTATEALAEIQRRAAGQAEAYANTNRGKLLASQIKVGEQMERIGEKILPALGVAMELVAVGVEALATAFGAGFKVIENVVSGVGEIVRVVLSGIIGVVKNVVSIIAEIPGPMQDTAKAWASSLAQMEDSVEAWGAKSPAAAHAAFSPVSDEAEEAADDAVASMKKLPEQSASALRSGYEKVQNGMADLLEALKNPISAAKRMAYLQGQLTSAELARGLASKDPVIRAEAEELRETIQTELWRVRAAAYGYGRDTGLNYAAGIRSSWQAVTNAARGMAARAGAPIRDDPDTARARDARMWGRHFAENYARGIEEGSRAVDRVVKGLKEDGSSGSAPAAANLTVQVQLSSLVPYTPGQLQHAVRVIGPEIVREFQRRGLLPRAAGVTF
jgi:hypothetical protein